MQWLVDTRSWKEGQAVVIYGDSQLIINFCNRKARPAVTDLYEAMQAVKACAARIPVPVYFRHIPRESNGLADWLTNVARQAGHYQDCTILCRDCTPFSRPPTSPEDAATAARLALIAPVTTRANKKRRLEQQEEQHTSGAGHGGSMGGEMGGGRGAGAGSGGAGGGSSTERGGPGGSQQHPGHQGGASRQAGEPEGS